MTIGNACSANGDPISPELDDGIDCSFVCMVRGDTLVGNSGHGLVLRLWSPYMQRGRQRCGSGVSRRHQVSTATTARCRVWETLRAVLGDTEQVPTAHAAFARCSSTNSTNSGR